MNKMQLISHRWLDPLNSGFKYTESSKEAFENLLERWYWLEFDINFSKDFIPFVFHDEWLNRISGWIDNRCFKNMLWNDIKNISLPNNCHFVELEELFKLIKEKQSSWVFSALHLKSKFQRLDSLDLLVNVVKGVKGLVDKIFIFDVRLETARYLRENNFELKIFLSVSHEYDKMRFNDFVGWTLYTLDEAIENKDIIDWVWLDEWDRKSEKWRKILYSQEIINKLRMSNFEIAMISPELHSKSPWLLWWESHEDARTKEILKDRIVEMINLWVDYICTDYLDYYSC